MEVPHRWAWSDCVFRMDLAIEPVVVVCIPWQPPHKFLTRTCLRSAYPHPRERTTLVPIYTASPHVRVEGIEYPKPRGNDVRPPDRLNDLVMLVVSYNSLLVTGHPSSPELVQKRMLGPKRRVHERNKAAAIIKLAQLSLTVGGWDIKETTFLLCS